MGGSRGWSQEKPPQRVGIACLAVAAAPLSLIEKSAEIENCDRKLQAALGGCGRRSDWDRDRDWVGRKRQRGETGNGKGRVSEHARMRIQCFVFSTRGGVVEGENLHRTGYSFKKSSIVNRSITHWGLILLRAYESRIHYIFFSISFRLVRSRGKKNKQLNSTTLWRVLSNAYLLSIRTADAGWYREARLCGA